MHLCAMIIVSTNIGRKRPIRWRGREVMTGIYKMPVEAPLFLGSEDVTGDDVVDRRYHGGVDQAVYAYGYNHYPYWENLYPDLEWGPGMFGENLTVDGLEEASIMVGDRFSVGDAIIEVTKPREPCYKLGVKFGSQKILRQFWNTTACGVYFKVLTQGIVSIDDEFILRKRGSGPSIAEVFISLRKNKKNELF